MSAMPGCWFCRGNPAIEHILNTGIKYTSGPRWLGENYLRGKFVIAVAGTHGKTTTPAMVAWILEYANKAPGFLIGGVPSNLGCSARDGKQVFVVEADEYDTAFFDKRAKTARPCAPGSVASCVQTLRNRFLHAGPSRLHARCRR